MSDARMLAELREWRARVDTNAREAGRWSMRLTIDELDMLLRIADERDALKRELCAEPDERMIDVSTGTPVCDRCGGRVYYSNPVGAFIHSGAVPPGCVPRPTPRATA